MEQRSDEWFEARLGKATASRIADIIAKTKSGPAASRKNYLSELVLERLTGAPAAGFMNAAMQWGVDTEPQARASYIMETGLSVEPVGFVEHHSIAMAGASPDGLVEADGLVEIKCPNTATHIDTLLSKKIPSKYITQMQWQMACTGRAWCDYVSFDPRLPGRMQMWIERVERDDAAIRSMEKEVTAFLREVMTTVEKLQAEYT